MAKPTDDGSPRSSSDVALLNAEHRSFCSFLGGVEDGEFNQDATDGLRGMVAAISDAEAERGGKPTATMTITVKLISDGGVVEVLTNMKIVNPKIARRKSIMWATPGNNLSPRNPKQGNLEFRTVGEAPMRTIRDDTTAVRAV